MGLTRLARTIRTARHLRWSQMVARAERTVRRHLPSQKSGQRTYADVLVPVLADCEGVPDVPAFCHTGLTGQAQINGRDELPIPEKVKCDQYYLNNQSFFLDLEILLRTVVKVLCHDGVQQADEAQSGTVHRKAA